MAHQQRNNVATNSISIMAICPTVCEQQRAHHGVAPLSQQAYQRARGILRNVTLNAAQQRAQ